jgi:iron complex transport system substrate-binding protein
MAPNLTELVYAIDSGDKLVGVSAWSDYPEAVAELPMVGDAFSVDHEQLAMLRPDLLLVWESGTPRRTVDELRELGYNVAVIRTRGLADVSRALLQIGALLDREPEAAEAAGRFQQQLADLRRTHEDSEPISVFYQVSARPLYTINREHYVSELISICGGTNVFADLNALAPSVSVESVVERDPEVMLATTDANDDGFAAWQRWPDIAANRYGNLFLLSADELARATPRLVNAGAAMCVALRQARSKRAAYLAQTERATTGAGDSTALPHPNPDGQEYAQPRTAGPTVD